MHFKVMFNEYCLQTFACLNYLPNVSKVQFYGKRLPNAVELFTGGSLCEYKIVKNKIYMLSRFQRWCATRSFISPSSD